MFGRARDTMNCLLSEQHKHTHTHMEFILSQKMELRFDIEKKMICSSFHLRLSGHHSVHFPLDLLSIRSKKIHVRTESMYCCREES